MVPADIGLIFQNYELWSYIKDFIDVLALIMSVQSLADI